MKIKLVCIFCLFWFGMCVSTTYQTYTTSSKFLLSDTLYIDSTETEYGSVVYLDAGTYNAVLLQVNDTNAPGFADDSAAFSVELKQVWDISPTTCAVMSSRANPDSTAWPGSSNFILIDSLDIDMMDTLVFLRDTVSIKDYNGSIVSIKAKPKLKGTTQRAANAYKYFFISPDYTPAYCFKITGKASNAKRGAGSKLVIRYEQLQQLK